MLQKCIVVGAIAGLSAGAHASLSYNFSQANLGDYVGAFQGSDSFIQEGRVFAPNGPALTTFTNYTPYSYTSSVPANFTSVRSAQTTISGAVQASSSRLEMTWNNHAVADLASDSNTEVNTECSPRLLGDITFTTATTVHMYFNAYSSVFQGADRASMYLTVNGNSDPRSPLPPFQYTSDTGGPVPVPIDFTFPVAAGSVLHIDLGGDDYIDSLADGSGHLLPSPRTGWDRTFGGSLIVETVPAPSGAGLLAITALAVARRRRS
jgi:hypothetical protein